MGGYREIRDVLDSVGKEHFKEFERRAFVASFEGPTDKNPEEIRFFVRFAEQIIPDHPTGKSDWCKNGG